MALQILGAAGRMLGGVARGVARGSARSNGNSNIANRLNKIQNQLERIPPQAYRHFKSITPKRTGNAKNKTNYASTDFGGSIRGDYPYANRLNEGYSKQAPDGMTKPTIDKIRQLVKRVI